MPVIEVKRRGVARPVRTALALVVVCAFGGRDGNLAAQAPPRPEEPARPAAPAPGATAEQESPDPAAEAPPSEETGTLRFGEVEFSEGEPPDAVKMLIEIRAPRAGDRDTVYFIGSVTWNYRLSGEPMKLQADLLVLYAELDEQPSAEDPTPVEEGAVEEDADGEPPLPGLGDDMILAGRHYRAYTMYAEGRVRIDFLSRETHLEADSFLYEHPSGMAVARGARLMTTVGHAQTIGSVLGRQNMRLDSGPFSRDDPLVTSPLVIRADVLRMYRFRYFDGVGVRVTNSTFAVPPVALESKKVDVYPADTTLAELETLKTLSLGAPARVQTTRGAADGAQATREDAYIIDPEDTWFALLGYPVAPLPLARWNTRWHNFLPIHSLELGNSSKFGFFFGPDWNLNYLTSLLPFGDGAIAREIDKNSRLGFDTIYFEKRGFGYGPNALYGSSPRNWWEWRPELGTWTYHGDARYFAIHDQGDEDRSTRLPVPREDRYWGHIWHRQAIPQVGLLDIEYSDLSDSAFLGEFFEDVAKQEKEQESLFYLRRNFGDNLALNGLYKYRTNDFQTQTERLPEGKGMLFQQPFFASGLYTDLEVSAANLRFRPGEPTVQNARRYDRYDVFNQWSYPMSAFAPFAQLRPFTFARYTYYGELADPNASPEDRVTFAAGVAASQQWSRVFRFEPDSFASRVLNIPQLKHLIVPQVTYLNVFANDLDSDDVIRLDDVDAVDLQETFVLSLRNDLLTRRPRPGKPTQRRSLLSNRDVSLESVQYETSRLFESNISLIVYPQPSRDNDGDHTSLLRLDNTAYVRQVSLRGWFELDPNRDFSLERMDLSARVDVIPDQLEFTVGERLTRPTTNVVYADARLWLTAKWAFEAYWSHDFERREDVELRFGVTRIFDRFAASFEVIEDVGQDDRTFFFSVSPVGLFRATRFRN